MKLEIHENISSISQWNMFTIGAASSRYLHQFLSFQTKNTKKKSHNSNIKRTKKYNFRRKNLLKLTSTFPETDLMMNSFHIFLAKVKGFFFLE